MMEMRVGRSSGSFYHSSIAEPAAVGICKVDQNSTYPGLHPVSNAAATIASMAGQQAPTNPFG